MRPARFFPGRRYAQLKIVANRRGQLSLTDFDRFSPFLLRDGSRYPGPAFFMKNAPEEPKPTLSPCQSGSLGPTPLGRVEPALRADSDAADIA